MNFHFHWRKKIQQAFFSKSKWQLFFSSRACIFLVEYNNEAPTKSTFPDLKMNPVHVFSRSWYKTVLTAQLLLLTYVYHKHTVSLPLRHLFEHIRAMDTAAVATCSYEETQLNVEKKVHWALNLEEIFFFYPDAKSKAPKSMLKKFQIKFRALKDNHRSNILEVFYRDHLFKIRSQIERIIEPLTAKIDAESKASHDLVNSDSYWDELFELYGNCKPALKE